MAVWVAVQPLPQPQSQPGQSRGRGREGVGILLTGPFVCFLMVTVELLRVIFFFFFSEMFVPFVP